MKLISFFMYVSLSCLAQETGTIRKLMEYDKLSGSQIIRLKCLLNGQYNRCSKEEFEAMGKKDCSSDIGEIKEVKMRDCINDIKSEGTRLCKFADIICEKKSEKVEDVKKDEIKVEKIKIAPTISNPEEVSRIEEPIENSN